MNRAPRRRAEKMPQTYGRRERTQAELEDHVQRLLTACSEQFAALAWEGYQRLGRGAVMSSEAHGAVFCPRADLHKFPLPHLPSVLSEVDHYDPNMEVPVGILMPQTEAVYQQVCAILLTPDVPPPQAKFDPMFVVRKNEPRH